jgi:hypothetical protein
MPTVTSENKAEFDRKFMEQRGQLKPDKDVENKSMSKSYDPAVVNLPLSKRGDIDKQIDKYKEEQKRSKLSESKKRSEENKEQKARAKIILEKHMATILEKTGPKFGEAKIKGLMSDWSKHEPHKVISFFDKFSKEHGIKE